MITEEKVQEQINYRAFRLSKTKLILGGLILFLLSFALYFPMMTIAKGKIRKALGSIPGCRITYQELKFELLFIPKIIIDQVTVPARCLGGNLDLPVKKMELGFRFFSFSPMGLSFALNAQALDTNINGNMTVGIFEHAVNINRNTIELEKLSPYLKGAPALKGKLELNMLVKFNNEVLKNLLVNINSSNFTLPPQKVQILDLPLMEINNLLIKLKSIEKGRVKVEKFIVGDDKAPLRANFTGTMKPNLRALILSTLDLKGELAFSEKFLQDFALIKTLMASFPQKNNFYQMRLKGTFGNIRPSPLK